MSNFPEPTIAEIKNCLSQNLAVDNYCVRWLVGQYEQATAERDRLREIVDKLKNVLSIARSDIFQTARANQMNLDGMDLTCPEDAPCTSVIGRHFVSQKGVDESMSVIELIDTALREAAIQEAGDE